MYLPQQSSLVGCLYVKEVFHFQNAWKVSKQRLGHLACLFYSSPNGDDRVLKSCRSESSIAGLESSLCWLNDHFVFF